MSNSDRRNLIFLHGAGSSAGFWHEQAKAFPSTHSLVVHTPTLPGHYGSDEPPMPNPTVADYARWVEAYVARHALDNVVLNGHSIGGAIALEIALRRPPWLAAVVLTTTGAALPVSDKLLTLLRNDYPAAVDFVVRHSFAPPAGPSGEMTYSQKVKRNGAARHLLKTPAGVALADYEACNRFDVTSRLGEIALPTHIIAAALDRMTPTHYSERLHAYIPGSTLSIVADASHMVPLERPREYNEVLKHALETLC